MLLEGPTHTVGYQKGSRGVSSIRGATFRVLVPCDTPVRVELFWLRAALLPPIPIHGTLLKRDNRTLGSGKSTSSWVRYR